MTGDLSLDELAVLTIGEPDHEVSRRPKKVIDPMRGCKRHEVACQRHTSSREGFGD